MSNSRVRRAKALADRAERVESSDPGGGDTKALRMIPELAERREEVEVELPEAVRLGRQEPRSWSEAGSCLGKQGSHRD